MAKNEATVEDKSLKQEFIEQLTKLSTSGLGLVAALAWNEAIQSFIKDYIEPLVPGTIPFYKISYAIIITLLVVIITYYLSKISSKLEMDKKES